MCTSFAVYSQKSIYGMNFDFPDVPIKVEIETTQRGEVFYLCFQWDGRYHKVAGVNQAGLFAAAQIMVAPFEIEPQPGDRSVTPYELFSRALKTGQNVDDVLKILGDRRLAYTTLRKGHQLYADIIGNTCVVEPGPEANRIYKLRESHTVLTNNLFERQQVRAAANMRRLGVDRFLIAEQEIAANAVDFSIANGFDLLGKTMLTRGRFTTQCSIVVDPRENSVYLSLKKDFEHLWKIDIIAHSLKPVDGALIPAVRSIPSGRLTSEKFSASYPKIAWEL
jgi:hypothetical protein